MNKPINVTELIALIIKLMSIEGHMPEARIDLILSEINMLDSHDIQLAKECIKEGEE